MSSAVPPEPFVRVLRDLAAWLRDTKVAGVLVGGVAVSLLGRPRTTRDVDVLVLIEEQQWQSFLGAGARFGFHAQRPRDWDDIVSIVEACPDLDRDRILANVAAVAEALETPALLARIKRILAGTSERGVTPFK